MTFRITDHDLQNLVVKILSSDSNWFYHWTYVGHSISSFPFGKLNFPNQQTISFWLIRFTARTTSFIFCFHEKYFQSGQVACRELHFWIDQIKGRTPADDLELILAGLSKMWVNFFSILFNFLPFSLDCQ